MLDDIEIEIDSMHKSIREGSASFMRCHKLIILYTK